MKKQRFIVFAALLSCVGLAVGSLSRSGREPEHDGHPLSYWLEELYQSSRPGVAQSDSKSLAKAMLDQQAKAQRAEDAIRDIGTNALPMLVNMVSKKRSTLKQKFLDFARKQTLIPVPESRERERYVKGCMGLASLGPLAKPVKETLGRLAFHGDPDVRVPLRMVLNKLDPEFLHNLEQFESLRRG